MRKLRVGVVDILGKSASRKAYSRFMRPNNMSIMPQVVAVWCEELGHDVSMAYYDGPELMVGGIPDDTDIVFINAFSQNAMLAYALSAYFRSKGMVTALGGPHARSFPENTVLYFDYAIGFTDKVLLQDLLQDCQPHRPEGQFVSADRQPSQLVSVRQRWKFMIPALEQAKFIRLLPVIGSLGCPYTCSFCIDALVPYQPLDYAMLIDDLRFIYEQKLPRTVVTWHDPNFGIKFDDYLGVIEEAVPAGSMTYLAETSLSRLTEENCKRMADVGFRVIAPGIESWYSIGDKSKLRTVTGFEKVDRVAEHINMVQSHIPYVQANLIFGLDADDGPEPFECTKRFVDLAPGVYPYFSLLMSYGRNAPDNLGYQRQNRVLNTPFHFLNQLHSMNVRPKNYTWPEFFQLVCDTYAHAYSPRAIYRRFKAVKHTGTRIEMLFRGISSERNHKYKGNHLKMLERVKNPVYRPYFDGETTELPDFFVQPIKTDLSWLWPWLPKDALYHDPNAYLKSLGDNPTESPMVHAGMATA